MPYNPGASYSGANYIAQSRIQGGQALVQAIMGLVGGLTEQSRQATENRKLLSTLYPAQAESFKNMSGPELTGYIQAKELEQRMSAAKALADYHTQQTAQMKSAQDAQNQVGPFFQAAANNLGKPTLTPADIGRYYETTSSEMPNMVPTGQASPLAAFVGAAAQYPAGAQAAGFGRDLLALIRAQTAGTGTRTLVPPQEVTIGANTYVWEPTTGKYTPTVATKEAEFKATHPPGSGKVRGGPEIPDGGYIEQMLTRGNQVVPGLYGIYDEKGKRVGTWSDPHAAQQGFPWNTVGVGGGNAPEAGGGRKTVQAGEYYEQNGQVYFWDGTKGVPVSGGGAGGFQ